MTVESGGYGTYGVGFRILRRKNGFQKPRIEGSETKAAEEHLDRLCFSAVLAKSEK